MPLSFSCKQKTSMQNTEHDSSRKFPCWSVMNLSSNHSTEQWAYKHSRSMVGFIPRSSAAALMVSSNFHSLFPMRLEIFIVSKNQFWEEILSFRFCRMWNSSMTIGQIRLSNSNYPSWSRWCPVEKCESTVQPILLQLSSTFYIRLIFFKWCDHLKRIYFSGDRPWLRLATDCQFFDVSGRSVVHRCESSSSKGEYR